VKAIESAMNTDYKHVSISLILTSTVTYYATEISTPVKRFITRPHWVVYLIRSTRVGSVMKKLVGDERSSLFCSAMTVDDNKKFYNIEPSA
jgi:hypothetical protein